MTTRIAESIARTLFEARYYLTKGNLSTTLLDFTYGGDLDAIEILFHAECAVRQENSQN